MSLTEKISFSDLYSFIIDSTSFQHGFKGVVNGFETARQQNQMDVEANVEADGSGLKEQMRIPRKMIKLSLFHHTTK